MKKYLAEFLGTFGIVFFGTGSIIVNELYSNSITHIGIAISFGLIVTIMIYSFADISGAHLNSAVTIAFSLKGSIPFKETLIYLSSQVFGALAASIFLHQLFPASVSLGATIPAGSQLQSFILEFILTFFLMLVILQTTYFTSVKPLAGIFIGSTVLLEALFAGPISGASMNPARSIAPALISGKTEGLWIYLTAPVIGAVFAIVMHHILLTSEKMAGDTDAISEESSSLRI